jgi:hypothetical protein
MVATQIRGRSGWRAVYAMGGRRAAVVRTEAIGGGKAMQEKEMMTQPRTDTAVLSQSAKDLSGYFMRDLPISKRLLEIADRLEEQEATIRHLRVEICNASAILMTHLETIKTIQAEVDLLNSRPKR